MGWPNRCLLIKQQRRQLLFAAISRPKALLDISEDIRLGRVRAYVDYFGRHLSEMFGIGYCGQSVCPSRAGLLDASYAEGRAILIQRVNVRNVGTRTLMPCGT